MTTIAIIYIPAHAYHAYAAQCLDYCDARGYQLAGVVCGNWHAAVTMLATSAVDVLIVARPEQLEAEIRGQADDDQPHIEFAVPPDPADARPAEQRTHLIARDAAASPGPDAAARRSRRCTPVWTATRRAPGPPG